MIIWDEYRQLYTGHGNIYSATQLCGMAVVSESSLVLRNTEFSDPIVLVKHGVWIEIHNTMKQDTEAAENMLFAALLKGDAYAKV